MASKPSALPVKQPGGGKRASAPNSAGNKAGKKAPAKAKKTAVQKARPRKLTLKQAYRKKSTSRGAGVVKRRATLATVRVDVGPEPVAVDAADEAAVAKIAKRQVRGRSAVERAGDPPQATGIALVERVTRAVERELSQIEVIVGGTHVNQHRRTEAERRARTLASLARTLTELRKLRADEYRVKPQDDPDRPRDIEELRRRLAERLERMRRGRTDPVAEGNEPGGDGFLA